MFLEKERIFVHRNNGITAGGVDYLRQSAQQQRYRDNYIRSLNTPPGPPTQQGIYASPEWTGQPYPSIDWQEISQNQPPPNGWPRPPRFNDPGDVPGPPVQFGPPITNDNVRAGYGFVPNGVEEKNLYFYHPDHLGSSSYITDKEGRVVQHTEYMAFGEVLFDEHLVSPKQPYLFNGKELDYETGLYYYGARYYDPKTSIFLNVDPLVEKTMSPYAYTYNNPINLIDPTGMEAEDPPKKSEFEGQIYKDGTGTFIGGKDGTWKATRPDGTKETLIPEITIRGKSSDTRAMEARMRLVDAISNCNACKGVEEAERFMFMPMIIATGGLSAKASLGVYVTKASISAGTQLLVNQNINLVKLTGDTLFNPISGSIFGNSAEYNISNFLQKDIANFNVSSSKNFTIGVGTDMLFMGRNKGYQKLGIEGLGKTVIEVQSEIVSQGTSKGIQSKYYNK